MKILVTAFDPFGGETMNPALEALRRLPDSMNGIRILRLELPTVFGKSLDLLKETVEKERPDAVLCMGQAGGREGITVERVGVNCMNASIPDNAGCQPKGEKIREEGPAERLATLPIREIVEAIQAAGLPASVSDSAGTFVCNHLLYGLLDFLAECHSDILGGFIHVPYATEQAAGKEGNPPSMDIAEMRDGIMAALRAINSYQRFADEDRQISDTELERLFKSRKRDYSEWEKADSEEHLSDVDEELLKRVIADGIESGRINRKYTDAAEMLAKLRVYHASTDSLTNAGRVLFSAKRPVLLKTAVYAGTEKTTFIKLNHFEGNVFECINEGISFILSSINWNVKIEGEARRREEPEIPQTAIREICVNAFAHGCYYSNTAFSIEIFSDRVVIYSPGFFPGGFKPEDFAYNAAEPIMLNPAIVSVLFKAGMIESFGSGFERTFTACEAAGIRYAYENTLTGFRFIMYRGRRAKNEKDLSGMEKAVLEQLMEEETLTMREMARTLSRSEKTIARAISGLKEKGYICREGSDNSGYWKIL